MQAYSFQAHKGTEPYIFVSYAHKDTELVFPILEELHRRGYRFWYDDGIAPGSEWPETIAQQLNSCSVFISFITPNTLESNNCRREINYALSKNKPFLSVLLCPTELSPGMELQLSSQQCVLKYKYTDEDEFFAKMLSCVDLDICRKKGPGNAPLPRAEKEQTPAAGAKKSRLLPAAFVCVCLALVLCFAYFLPRLLPADEQTQAPLSDNAADSQLLRTIYLSAGDMTGEQFADAIALLKGRLELLAPEQYDLTREDDRYVLTFPQSCCKNNDVEKVLCHYLVRPIDLYFQCNKNQDSDLPMQILIDRNDIEALKPHNGYLPGIDVSKYGITSDTYTYLELTLTQNWAEANADLIHSWGKDLLFVQDLARALSSQGIATFPAISAGTDRSFYLIVKDDTFLELLLHNWTTPSLPAALSFEVVDVYTWEDPAGSRVAGNHQVPEAALNGNLVTISYDYYDEEAELPTLMELEISMKARFDLLDQPYSFGRSIDRPYSLVFRTNTDRMSPDLAELLGSSPNMSLKSSLTSLPLDYKDSLNVVSASDGSAALCLTIDNAELLKQYTAFVSQQKDQTVTLWIEDVPFATAKIPVPLEDGTLQFHNCTLAEQETLSENKRHLYEILTSLNTKPCNSTHSLTLRSISIDEASPQVFGLPVSDFSKEISDAYETLDKAVTALCPEAETWLSGKGICISLHQSLDENLISPLPIIREIFCTADLGSSPLLSVSINPFDEIGTSDYVISINKIYKEIEDGVAITDGYICYYTIFINECTDTYTVNFNEQLQNDPYISSFAAPE